KISVSGPTAASRTAWMTVHPSTVTAPTSDDGVATFFATGEFPTGARTEAPILSILGTIDKGPPDEGAPGGDAKPATQKSAAAAQSADVVFASSAHQDQFQGFHHASAPKGEWIPGTL